MLSIFFEVIWKFTKFKVLFYLKRSKGKSVEADRINRHLDNIRAQINKHYQSISDQDSFVSAEKVKNAYLGIGDKYRMLLEAFEKFTCDYQKRIGIDRCYGVWKRYYRPFACFHAKGVSCKRYAFVRVGTIFYRIVPRLSEIRSGP